MTKSLCRACDHIFSSVKAFDLHRTGSFKKNTRRCMSKEEMRAKGLIQNAKGWWTTPASGRAPWTATAHEEEGEEATL
jgi:hypothetical protein